MEPQLSKDGFLIVLQDGTPLCRISGHGAVRYRQEDISGQEQEAAQNRVTDLAGGVAKYKYMNLMENSSPLKTDGLDEDYRLLANFNGIVLAGHATKYGVQFVTWDRDYDKTGVSPRWLKWHHNGFNLQP